MPNVLLEKVEFKIVRTRRGTWRRYLYPTGARFSEYTSAARLFGLPLVHLTLGVNPETGGRVVARGVFAFGRVAVGVFPFGQAAFGLFPFGQLAVGVAAVGQGAFGLAALGQLAVGAGLAVGQLAAGWVAIGQLALGHFALAQAAFGEHLWTPGVADPEAVRFFRGLLERWR
jgi:hypothetical protein